MPELLELIRQLNNMNIDVNFHSQFSDATLLQIFPLYNDSDDLAYISESFIFWEDVEGRLRDYINEITPKENT
jgi:hypothetical protein